ncbi:MAG: hypothetical protein AAFW89_00710 [Bacteroidota bacterium]
MRTSLALLIGLLLSITQAVSQTTVSFTSNLGEPGIDFPQYWKSTGFSPSDLMDYPDMLMTLDYVEASGGVTWMRPHYLLDNVEIYDFGMPTQRYNWEGLDAKLDAFVERDFKLIFELMGGPIASTIDFADHDQLVAFKKLVTDLAIHLQQRYGQEVIEGWLFESVNEPDIWYFWTDGYIKYLNYYDAVSEGLKEANPNLRFGGPGTAVDGISTFLQILLEHCAHGKNYFTGEQGTRIDFISIHKKFAPHQMIDAELENWNYIYEKFPQYRNIPIINDEADPLIGWADLHHWRTGPWYGAFMVQSVDLHNTEIIDELPMPYLILSNDHGFLGSWRKRTQLARFIPGNNQNRSRGSVRVYEKNEERRLGLPPTERFYLIKQPTLTLMNMMSLYGEERFNVERTDSGTVKNAGLIVTKNKTGDVILSAYNKPEMDILKYQFKAEKEAPADHRAALDTQYVVLQTQLTGLEDGSYTLIEFLFDEENSNPFYDWEQMGAPEDPSAEEYLELVKNMEPAMVQKKEVRVRNGQFDLSFDFPGSATSFTFLMRQKVNPDTPSNLRTQRYTGLNNEDIVMLNWDVSDPNRLQFYEVHAKAPGARRYKQINPTTLTSRGFAHAIKDANGYTYKVRAVNAWGKKGGFSEPLKITQDDE